jgi:signal transduction histidine kinase/ActR/RegA family two-component response regulator
MYESIVRRLNRMRLAMSRGAWRVLTRFDVAQLRRAIPWRRREEPQVLRPNRTLRALSNGVPAVFDATDAEIGNLELADILDAPAIQSLLEDHHRVVQIPLAIVDLKGEVLVGVGWQDVCTQFHRAHPETCAHCRESDVQLSAGVPPGEFKLYQCKNHMWDMATPIIIAGRHMGNLFSGQFFFQGEHPDHEQFRLQARRYGFDESQYLAALERVPRLSRETVNANMRFFAKLAEMVSKLSYANIKLARALAERDRLTASLRHSEEQLREAKNAAETANAAKSQFLANVSHELRTPMNAILGMTDLALAESLAPGVRDSLETVKESADVLLALLNEILDFSRIEAGKLTLESRPFALRPMLDDTLRSLAVKAREKGLEIGCRVAPDVPENLHGDRVRLRQVLVNLLSNAIKFTDQGQVRLDVDQTARTDGEVVLGFSVEDTGVGIAREDQQRIFAPFTQADSSTTRRHGGTGLGLSIAASIVQMMGGRISVESEPGRGSVFMFTARFALAVEQPVPSSEPRPAAVAAPARSLQILLAEDTPANQKLVVRILSKRGHQVAVAENGAQAVALFQQQPFDAVLMDVQMPVMDGLEATEAIQELQHDRPARVPIIAMTAHALKRDQERCLAAGMDAYLAKPVSSRELVELVERLATGQAAADIAPGPH